MYSTSQHKPAARTKKIIINTADERTFTARAPPPPPPYLSSPLHVSRFATLVVVVIRCANNMPCTKNVNASARAHSLFVSLLTSLLKCSLLAIASGELCDYKTNLF